MLQYGTHLFVSIYKSIKCAYYLHLLSLSFILLFCILIVVFYRNVCICVNVSVDCIYRGYPYLSIFLYLYYCILYSGLLEALFRSLSLHTHRNIYIKVDFDF